MPDVTKPARHFFTEAEGKEIVETIRVAEQMTSGEVRVHLENRCRLTTPMKRATRIFKKLKMHKTDARNGVLIYLAVKDHKIVLLADRGINEVVPEGFWDQTVHEIEQAFKTGKFLEGLKTGILEVGKQLKHYFPRTATDENQLPDDISYGKD